MDGPPVEEVVGSPQGRGTPERGGSTYRAPPGGGRVHREEPDESMRVEHIHTITAISHPRRQSPEVAVAADPHEGAGG